MNDRAKPSDDGSTRKLLPEPSVTEDDDRYAIDPRTGFEYVKRRPGERLVTSEEILKELEDFP